MKFTSYEKKHVLFEEQKSEHFLQLETLFISIWSLAKGSFTHSFINMHRQAIVIPKPEAKSIFGDGFPYAFSETYRNIVALLW